MPSNPTLTCIEERRSVRVFQDRPLEKETEEAILHAATRAPTAANMQLYSILIIRDPRRKELLAERCNHQPWLARAPLMLVFCADYQRMYDYYDASGVGEKCMELGVEYIRPGEQYLLLAACDAMIAAQNAVLAAQSLGAGSCYVGHIMDHYEENQELLALPPYVFPVTLLAIGYPAAEPKGRTPRFESKYLVFEDQYRRLSPEELSDCYSRYPAPPAGSPSGAENAGQYHYLRRHVGATCYWEGIRSLRVALKNWNYRREAPDMT